MTFTYPKFYDSYLPPSFSSENPILTGLLSQHQKHVTSPPYQLETTLHTSDGVVLHNFAKSTDFHKGIKMVHLILPIAYFANGLFWKWIFF